MDLSLVYGSNNDVAASLRAGFGGRLLVEVKKNQEFPPEALNKTAMCDLVYENEPCYATGENIYTITYVEISQDLIIFVSNNCNCQKE